MCELKPTKAVVEKMFDDLEGRHLSRLEASTQVSGLRLPTAAPSIMRRKQVLHRTSTSGPEAWLPPLSLSRQHQRFTKSGVKRQRVYLSLVSESPSL